MDNFDTNLKRLEEMFFQSKGSTQKESNLKAFLKHVFMEFANRYLRGGRVVTCKKIVYKGLNPETHLALLVATHNYHPELTGIEMQGRSDDFSKVFSQLKGKVEARYQDLNLEDIDKKTAKFIRQKRKNNNAKTGILNLYFSKNPAEPDRIQKLELVKPRKERLKKLVYEPVNLEEVMLDEYTSKLLQMADTLFINNCSYLDNNFRFELLSQKCMMVQTEPGKYFWNYKASTVNNQPLPKLIFETINNLFSIIEPYFNVTSYTTMEIIHPSHTIIK